MAALALRVAIFLVPFMAGFAAGALVALVLADPVTAYDVAVWWVLVISASTVAATLVDRLARRLLPMTVLLRMTMLFPDRAPSRMRVALRSGNIRELRERIAAVHDSGDADTGEMSELIISLSTALSRHDRKTRGHSERTRAYTDILAEEIGLDDNARDRLRWAALLHDVGKLEIPIEVLNKEGKLTTEEWDLVRQHPIHGMKLVSPLLPWLGEWAKTIEHHHERWDGTGYPHGLAGSDIAHGARIVAVADAYDVMTTGRSYQKAKTPAAARAEIAEMAGSQFDPAVVRALMNVSLGRMRWSTGPLAMLAELPFLRGLPELGRDTATLLTSSAVMATSIATGVVTTPVEFTMADAAQVVEAVISGNGLSTTVAELADPDEDEEIVAAPDPTTSTSQPEPDEEPGEVLSEEPETTTSTTAAPTTTTKPKNESPRVDGDTASTVEDTAVLIDVLSNDSDVDGKLDPETLQVVSSPDLGDAFVEASRIAYTPAPNRWGSDAFEYRVCDTVGACAEATVSVDIDPVNDPPSSSTLAGTTREDELLTLSLAVTDPDEDPVSCVLAEAPATGAATVPADCSKLVYQPGANHHGTVGVAIEASDGQAASMFTVAIEVTPVNDAPVVADDAVSTPWSTPIDIPVLSNDADPDGDPLTVRITQPPAAGASSVTSGGAIRYAPVQGPTSTYSIGYEACDAAGACSPGTVTVQVFGLTVAADDAAETRRDRGVEIDVRANDVPGSGEWGNKTLRVIQQPDWGGTQVTGHRRIMYWPSRRWTGTDTFVYEICDTSGSCDTATVTIVVTRR